MSKIESGKMKLVKDDFQLDKMIGELYPLLEAKFEEKSQKYHQEIHLVNQWFYCLLYTSKPCMVYVPEGSSGYER